MMNGRLSLVVLAILGLALGLLPLGGCQPADPRSAVLKERARWTVELTSWVPKADGQVSVGVKLSGPPNSALDELTFRIWQLGADEQRLAEDWKTIDTADVPRGGPKEIIVSVPAAEGVEGMAVSLVLNPTAEDAEHIVELQGL